MDRIAIVMSHASRSMTGAARDLVLAGALRARGVETQVFRMHPGREVETEEILDVPVTFCPSDNPEVIAHKQVSDGLRQAVRAFAPDAVLYKGLGYGVNADLHASLPEAVRIGLVVGGGVADPLLPRAALVLGEYREQLHRCFREHLTDRRALVLPKWIDLSHAGSGKPPRTPDFEIVNVGNFHEARKNQEALLPLTDRHRIAFVGAGPRMGPARRNAARPDYATFFGKLEHPEVFDVLRRSAIMVHTSTMDGLPRSTVEAMACGLPVIAYRSTIDGGIPPGAGLLISPGALRHAVDLLLTDTPLRTAMGQAARAHVQRNHGKAAIEAAAEEVLKVLRR
jgi:glycosyltransferase involved in cell wall biosynthesis